jgi:hypothetical protein
MPTTKNEWGSVNFLSEDLIHAELKILNQIKNKHNINTREKLQTSTGERKHINTEKWTNKRKMKKNTQRT